MSSDNAERRSLVYKLLCSSIARVDQSLAEIRKKDDAKTAKALEEYSKCIEKPEGNVLKCQEGLKKESLRLRDYERTVEQQTIKTYSCLNGEFTKDFKVESDFEKGVKKCLDDFEKSTIALLTKQADN